MFDVELKAGLLKQQTLNCIMEDENETAITRKLSKQMNSYGKELGAHGTGSLIKKWRIPVWPSKKRRWTGKARCIWKAEKQV